MMKRWYIFFFYPKWIHFISSWEIQGECVILLVEGCSLIQSAMKCNWIAISEFASFGHLFKYSKNSGSFYSNQISLISTVAREKELITVCLESEPAYLGLVNLWTRTWTSHFAMSYFLNSQGWWQSSSCTTVLRNNWATPRLHLSLIYTAEKGLCRIFGLCQDMTFTPVWIAGFSFYLYKNRTPFPPLILIYFKFNFTLSHFFLQLVYLRNWLVVASTIC